MGTLAVGGGAYALMPSQNCQPIPPAMAAPSVPQNSTGCAPRGSSGGGYGASSRFSFFGGDNSSSRTSSASTADASSGGVTRGGFGSFARAFGFSGRGWRKLRLLQATPARCREITSFHLLIGRSSARIDSSDNPCNATSLNSEGPHHETLAPHRADIDGKCCRQRRIDGLCAAASLRSRTGGAARPERQALLPRDLWRLRRRTASFPWPRAWPRPRWRLTSADAPHRLPRTR